MIIFRNKNIAPDSRNIRDMGLNYTHRMEKNILYYNSTGTVIDTCWLLTYDIDRGKKNVHNVLKWSNVTAVPYMANWEDNIPKNSVVLEMKNKDHHYSSQ